MGLLTQWLWKNDYVKYYWFTRYSLKRSALVLDKNISTLTHSQSAKLRNQYRFYISIFNLLPVYTVFENVEFALLLQKYSSTERKLMVEQALSGLVYPITEIKDLTNYLEEKVNVAIEEQW